MTIKKKLKNAKDKTAMFCKRHKKAIIGTLTGIGAFGLGWYGVKKLKSRDDDHEAEIGLIPEDVGGMTVEDMIGETEEEKSELGCYREKVQEERKDDFQKMFDFVDEFNIKDNEAWIIAGPKSEYGSDSGIDVYLVDENFEYIPGYRPELEEPKEAEEP